MTVQDIRIFGDPVLTTRCEPIRVLNSAVQTLVRDLLDTTGEPGRAGVAAPQIGVSLRAFSYNVDGQVGYVINPEVVHRGAKIDAEYEGCLSLPELWSLTPRHRYVVVKGIDLRGDSVTVSGEDLLARCLQHEVDHLDGALYIDRLERAERRLAMRNIRAAEWFK